VVEGFVYVSDDRPGPMEGAAVGTRVRTPSWDPPWIVVAHRVDAVIVARWPGRLLRVTGVEPSGDEERTALARIAEGLRPDAGYTRVFAVDVLAELPPATLFGPHGEVVVELLEYARLLGEPVAGELAAARHPDADQAYSRAWHRWLARQPNSAPYRNRDHSHVLAIPGAGRVGSPVGHGFMVLWRCVADSARHHAGSAAFTVDEEGDEVLLDPWSAAASVLLDTAMARAAPDLVDSADVATLTTAWRAVTRPDP
jgi:hypothetical protein